jgi:tetratricopeptide (TPR) repeat protein
MRWSVLQMLRALFVSAAVVAIAGPALADDLDLCRDRQTEAKARLDACEKIVAAGQATAKDLGIANFVRGQAFVSKGNNDKAVAAFDAAHAADPDALEYVTWRGLAYERKGDDDHALADYNLVLQARPQAALDIVRDDVWNSTKHEQQPFIYGSPPGREDFYFVAGK